MANENTTSGGNAPIVDDKDAPEIFCDMLRGAFLVNENVHIDLTSMRSDRSSNPPRFYEQVSCRPVMPFRVVEQLTAELARFVAQMNAQANAPANVPRTVQ